MRNNEGGIKVKSIHKSEKTVKMSLPYSISAAKNILIDNMLKG